ncbi:MAG: flippase-like domain-containing protein, partial [Anaerolineae bacterium]|nr:flippase-like domain-containing protein [Anaerolineae bacterium]
LAPLAHLRSAVWAVFWSVISWALSVIAGYVLLFAFFPAASWPAAFLVVGLASLAVSVPYAPGAVGPYEAGVVMALAWAGMDASGGTAVAFAVVLHVMNTAVFVVLGLEGLIHQGVTLGQVMQGARGVKTAPES